MKIKEQLQQFIGKQVICKTTGNTLTITQLDGMHISAKTEAGQHYQWRNGTAQNDNAIYRGTLTFVDPSLKEPFCQIYNAYCNSEDGRLDCYFYNMQHFD